MLVAVGIVLHCTHPVIWCVKVTVDLLVSDPLSQLTAAFVPSGDGPLIDCEYYYGFMYCTCMYWMYFTVEYSVTYLAICCTCGTLTLIVVCMQPHIYLFSVVVHISTHSVYLFDPSSPTPLAVHKSVCLGKPLGGLFVPPTSSGGQSTLYFMDNSQVSVIST